MSTLFNTRTSKLGRKLCSLIEFKENDDLSEIRELLNDKDLNVNFKNAAINNNTPLHLAIESEDLELIKLLLQYNADVSIENNSGESSEKCAQKCENGEIVNLLRAHYEKHNEKTTNNTMKENDMIDKKFVFECTFEALSSFLINDIDIKVLKIRNCKSVEEALKTIQIEIIYKFSNLFVIILELLSLDEKSFSVSFNETLKIQRPLIIEVVTPKSSNIYFKTGLNHAIVNFNGNFDVVKYFESNCNLNSLAGYIKNGLLNAEIPFELRKKLIEIAVKKDELCVRFLKLFKGDFDVETFKDLIISSIGYTGGIQTLLGLLDLPFDTHNNFTLTNTQQNDLGVKNSDGLSDGKKQLIKSRR